MSRRDVPDKIAAELLAANNHTCCICRERGKHVQLHHIDGDSSNSVPSNLAVLCLDDHSRVTGDEGLGRRFTPQEVTIFKLRWESMCAEATDNGDEEDEEDDEAEEPLDTFFQTRRIRAKDEYARTFPMGEGDELICSISADDYVDISICTAQDYQRWLDDEELNHYDISEEDVRHCDLQTFVAPHNGQFVLLIMNDNEEDVDVTVDVAIWASEEEDDDEG
jgi:hypothetical protein